MVVYDRSLLKISPLAPLLVENLLTQADLHKTEVDYLGLGVLLTP